MAEENKKDLILDIKDLVIHYETEDGVVEAVNGLDIQLEHGKTLGLVGETGSGKTTTALSILRLVPDPPGVIKNGSIILDGKDILNMPTKELEHIRGNLVSMIFQDPIASLNPRMTVQEIIAEGLKIRGVKDQAELHRRVVEMLEHVGLQAEHASRYPHEFSGGQRQRIGIARALIVKPQMVIADEPVSALDVSVQAQVINLLNQLKSEMGLTILFIAHNLSVVKYFSDRIGVMYYGKLVEMADSDELFAHPMHPYTRALLSAIPEPDPVAEKKRKKIHYDPAIHQYGEGEQPSYHEASPGHTVYCSDREFEEYKNAVSPVI